MKLEIEVDNDLGARRVIDELRSDFEERKKRATYYVEHSGNFAERWRGAVAALDVCLDKLEALERGLA